jgi:hypothetical protein
MPQEPNIEIGRIREIFLGIEDHGILALAVHLSFGSKHQGYGHFAIDTYDAAQKKRVGCAGGGEVLLRLHTFLGVTQLRQGVGQAIIVERDDGSAFGDISRLRRLPCDGGAVFDVKAIFAKLDGADAPSPRLPGPPPQV